MKHFSLEKTPLRESGLVVLVAILALSTTTRVYAQELLSPRGLQVEIFADGVVSIEYTLDVDTTYASIDVTLFGTPLDDIIVLNHRDEPLDYELTETRLKIYTLGTYRVRILYDTRDLTDEVGGGIWTFLINSPINVTISLPKEVDFIPNKAPISIETIEDKTVVTMPAGDLELVYTWTLVEIIQLQVTMQLSSETVTTGESVTISAAVRDTAANPVEGATVTATIGDLEVLVLLSDQGNGDYQGTIDTSNAEEGTYDIAVTAQKTGYQSAQTSASLRIEAKPAEIPWMLYGGIAAIAIIIAAVLLYKIKMKP